MVITVFVINLFCPSVLASWIGNSIYFENYILNPGEFKNSYNLEVTKDTVEDCEKWCQEHHQCTAWKFYKEDESKQKKYCALMDDTDIQYTATFEWIIDWDSGILRNQMHGRLIPKIYDVNKINIG